MKELKGVIYRIWNRVNGKSYIGKSIHAKKRIRSHINGYSHNIILRKAIKKYGKDAFVVEILESDVPESLLSKFECLHIRFWNAKVPNGYNLTDGGEGRSGWKASQETRRKMSESRKGKTPWNKGKTGVYSEETRKKMSEVTKGRQHSPEARRKMLGRTPWIKGKHHSADTRRKIGEAQKGKSPSPETRRKISEGLRGEKNPYFGKSHSPETRRKLSEAMMGNKNNRRPEYNEARFYYFLSLPADMPLKEKRKCLREQFPDRDRSVINRWIRRWELEGGE